MATLEDIKFKNDLKRVTDMPSPQEDLRKASNEELCNEFITLRLFVASQVLWCKDLATIITELQKKVEALESELQEFRSASDTESRSQEC